MSALSEFKPDRSTLIVLEEVGRYPEREPFTQDVIDELAEPTVP